ncbi:MAG: hypothetical protein K6L76_10215 [Agarilytica sp.]
MKNKRACQRLRNYSLLVGASLCFLNAFADPIDLATEPLFLQDSVQPNILIVADDSLSMSWEALMNTGDTGGNTSGLYVGTHGSSYTALVPNPNNDLEARHLCHGFNTMAYNPNRTYSPWKGYDQLTNEYSDINELDQAMNDPYEGAATSNLRDLTHHFYFLWADNGNGEYNTNECSGIPWLASEILISQRISRCRAVPSQCVYVGDLSHGVEHGAPGEEQSSITNYANWYTYYRKRAYVAQRALSELVAESDARMGLGTLNDVNNVGRAITDMRINSNKNALLHAVGDIGTNYLTPLTPLRQALYDAGNYYQSGDNDLFDGRISVSSPIATATGGACQQNYTILMSDGFWNSSGPNIGNVDGDDSSTFDGPSHGNIYGDAAENTLADVAMYFFENDLSTLADQVPESSSINNGELNSDMHQHMVTYTVAFGLNGDITCDPLEPSCMNSLPCNLLETPPPNCSIWPDTITQNTSSTVDDMRHAAINGRGEFLSANNPDTLIASLESAISDIEARNSSSAAVAANSTSLNAGTVIYQAKFNTGDWSGDLISVPISIGSSDTRPSCSSVDIGQPCPTANWNAGTDSNGINSQNFDTGRVVVTYSTTSTGEDTAVAFRWPANSSSPTAIELSADQVSALGANPSTGTLNEEYGENLVNYIRGDRSNEIATSTSPSSASAIFRQRDTSVLGDIITSAPRFVGPPNSSYTENDYATFAETHESRQPIVYVGANDGMLHAFNANADSNTGGGDVVFSYIPGASYPHIRDLADPDYQHRYYVDGSPTSADVYYGGSWHTVLTSGLKAGGQKIFALDITDPNKFTENQSDINDVFLWEFEHPELGYTFSEPDIIKLNDDTWAAIFGNGYNNTEADGSPSASGHASLFIVDIETGSLIENISTGAGSIDTPNGLATVTPVDEDRNGTTDYIYAGDLEGNLWRFDLSNNISSAWNATQVFTAVSREGNPQPITSRPSVSFHPENGRDGFLIYFGTGRYIDASDNNTSGVDTQSFYAVWDDLTSGTLPALNRGGDDYLQQEIVSQGPVTFDNGTTDPGDDVTVSVRFTSTQDTDELIDWSTQKGWFIDFIFGGNNNGERQVSRSILRGDRIVFVTISPDDIPCNYGGTSTLMELSIMDGQPASSPPLDINGDGVINSSDIDPALGIPSGISLDGLTPPPEVVKPDGDGNEFKLTNSSSGATISIMERAPNGADQTEAQRTSWTELVNF